MFVRGWELSNVFTIGANPSAEAIVLQEFIL